MASDGETSCASDQNFAVIYSFLKVFGKLYGLELPTITKLQEFIENTQEVPEQLKDLHLRLLRRAQKSLHSNRWEKGLIKFCHQQGHHQDAWEIERFSYKKASTQVKLKILKSLLEYQFTCHPKFKSAVNALECKDLRLDPIGRDKSGCVYWLQVDHEANLCLYKEDQDEETWQLVARSREELVKVIEQLKKGEEVCPLTTNATEDSSGAENPPPEAKSEPETKPEVEEDNEEEFLSPESETDQEDAETEQTEQTVDKKPPTPGQPTTECKDNNEQTDKVEQPISEAKESPKDTENLIDTENTVDTIEDKQDSVNVNKVEEDTLKTVENEPANSKETNVEEVKEPEEILNSNLEEDSRSNEKEDVNNVETKPEEVKPENEEKIEITEEKSEEKTEAEEVGEAIEEPVMHVTGEGNGADCESYFIGEEISEPVMYFYGEGWGYDNDTGNPDIIQETNDETHSDEENDNEELLNGEHERKTNLSKSIKLKNVNKRTLKKQPNDSNDMKPDVKKPCVRDVDKSNSSLTDNDKKETSNDKSTTDNESPNKSNIKKSRSKVKMNAITRKVKLNDGKEAINSTETDHCQDKTSIIEKRKSSVSSVEHEEESTENDKEKSPEKDTKVEEPLPPKKLRLEPTPESDNVDENPTHSKETDPVSDSLDNENKKDINDSISKRKKIKATKGKFKRKNILRNSNKTNDSDKGDNNKKACKSLKRSLVDATLSDKNKTESQSESEDDEPITSGKRLKIKPKKIITSSRKKVEAKHMEKHSSDESEEETLYSLAGKKSTKKLTKKKVKGKQKGKKPETKSDNESDLAPVRQSRRIAQQKIKEEAERRQQEEVALRELKLIHKKKGKDDDDEEEWVRSGGSSSEGRVVRKSNKWRADDSTGPEPDSDSDSPLFELHHPEADLEFGKSDHEFSPESDLESGEPAEPLKSARTLQEEKDDGYCLQCGSAEQPEWILLCDGCDGGYHASCLKPMLFLVPQGDWFCPTCNHDKLIKSLESELVKYDELLTVVEEERARRKLEEPEPVPQPEQQVKQESDADDDSESSGSWSGSSGGVYRLRARRHVPVSLRAQEYDRLISQAIKEEYVEPTTSAGNQGRGKDISTIIEAAEEEKMKAEREAVEQGKPVELKKFKKKQRRKPRKLNSLEVPSEDDGETDEDFKDTGGASSSEDISSSAERDSSNDSRSSDSLPIRRTGSRIDKKDRVKMRESSPEVKKKKKGLFQDSSSESAGAKEWSNKNKVKSRPKKRDKHEKHKKRRRGLTQYDAEGNVIRARVTYGGLSGSDENDWSPKHRTRQKKINYTEMPNTESEDEMHKSSGKHMPDSSDEFKISSSDDSSSDSDKKRQKENDSEEKRKALTDLVKKTAVVPLEKLPEDVTKAKTEELQAHLSNLKESSGLNDVQSARPPRGRGSRGGRGGRSGRGRGRGRGTDASPDDALAKLVGVKIKELGQDGSPTKPNQLEREKKRQEREAKLAEKEAKKLERMQKREEKEKMKEMKAKEREEKKQAKLAMQETKRIKKEKDYGGMGGMAGGMGGMGGTAGGMAGGMGEARDMFPPDYRPQPPRLQVRAELRGIMSDERGPHGPQLHNALREGTLSVAGSPQPFRPVSEEPSIITRMPHMLNQQYNRGGMMYGSGGGGGGPPTVGFPRGGFPPAYYRLPQHYPPHHDPHQHPHYRHMHGGSGGPSPPIHHPGGGPPPGLQPGSFPYRPGPPLPGGPHLAPDSRPNLPHPSLPPGGKHIPENPSPLLQNLGQPGPHPQNLHPNMNPMISGHPQNMGPGRPQQSLGPGGPPGVPISLNPQSLPPGGPLNHQSIPPGAQVPSTVAGPSATGAQGPPGPPTSQPSEDMPIKIKAEVKTEQPEYRSPPGSPCESAEPPRHPKIKVTERRPRFPLGPYAPHLHYPPHYPANYSPHAPPAQDPHHAPHNMQQYGGGEASNNTSSPPPRGYLPPGMRFPPGSSPLANGTPPRHPGLHQPFVPRHLALQRHPLTQSPHHPSVVQPPSQPSHHPGLGQHPLRVLPPTTQPSHHPGVVQPPQTQSAHHPGLVQPPPTQSPHQGVGQPPPARSPRDLAPLHRPPGGKSPPRPSQSRSPHHPGPPPTHSLPPGPPSSHQPGGPPSSQSPHLTNVPPTRSPLHPAGRGPSPSRSPHHPGGPPGLPPPGPHLLYPSAQSPHHPAGPHGPLPSQSPHMPGGSHGPPPSQSPHQPGGPPEPSPAQSPHHPGLPPPPQSPHQPGPPPAQSPHHLPPGQHGPPPSRSPHHPPGGLHGPPQSPHNPHGPSPSQSPHHLPGPHGPSPSQSPHHLPGPHPSQSPHHPGLSHPPQPTVSPHNPLPHPFQNAIPPHHPGLPPRMTMPPLHRPGLPPPPPLLQSLGNNPSLYSLYSQRLPGPIPRDSLPSKPLSPRREANDEASELPVSLDRVKREPNREEGSVFGGLVSYFSSQHEDDIDG